MSQHEPSSLAGLYLRLAGILVLILLAGVAGLWMGERSMKLEESPSAAPQPAAPAPESESQTPHDPAPLFFFARFAAGAAQTVVAEEIAMAAAEGVHQYFLAVPLPWEGDMNVFLQPIDLLLKSDPRSSLFLYVTLDPPPAWLAEHPSEAARVAGKEPVFASLASEIWRRDAHTALEALISSVNLLQRPATILGYAIACQEGGAWKLPDGYDTSEANAAGFRQWLQAKYKEPATLQQAWGDAEISFETAAIPEQIEISDGCAAFLDLPKQQRHSDFLQYTSECAADTIASFAANIKKACGGAAKVIATYGYSYECTSNTAGHFALSRLFKSDVDGFASPISYVDRGLGGVGGVMGPVSSALEHGKAWYVIDDTRTGLTQDPATGEIARPKNLRAEDVYGVQQRNFATAMANGLGLCWSDPEGEGWLHDAEMWQGFGKMRAIYEHAIEEKAARDEHAPSFPNKPMVAVIVDESSRFVQRCDKKVNEILLNQVRDTVLRTGVPAKFYLLQDVLERNVPEASVYLFLNAFRLSADERTNLHALMEQTKAIAIWMYAPGYFDKECSADNVSATTRIKVRRFDGPAWAGSQFLLPERWMGKDEEFGEALQIDPLFYIDDPETNAIASFRTSGKPSVAISFFYEGWTSVFCAEPSLTPALLRQILSILEIHVFVEPGTAKFYDAMCFGPNLLAIHAKESGDRLIDLDRVCDVRDLLTPEIGWPRKRSLTIPLKTGETRLLELDPVDSE